MNIYDPSRSTIHVPAPPPLPEKSKGAIEQLVREKHHIESHRLRFFLLVCEVSVRCVSILSLLMQCGSWRT